MATLIIRIPKIMSSMLNKTNQSLPSDNFTGCYWKIDQHCPFIDDVCTSKNGDYPMTNCDFPMTKCNFPMTNCDFPWNKCDL